MTRRYGRAEGKERVYEGVPLNKAKNVTIISAIGINGMKATMTVNGAMNGKIYEQYIKEYLLPQLEPGSILVADNLPTHKVKSVAKLLSDAFIGLQYLPAYSPDLNPIEQMWSKLKAYLRKVKPRTYDELYAAISNGLQTVSSDDCIAWITHDGYLMDG
jgi:transposase